jgi:class 3 adenylate cyclase
MENLPSGTVTFLFTDIKGSTKLWQEQPKAMAIAHAQHNEIVREAIEPNHRYVFQLNTFTGGSRIIISRVVTRACELRLRWR